MGDEMADPTVRSADVLAENFTEQLATNEELRNKIAADPASAGAELKALAGSAKDRADASQSGKTSNLEAEAASSAASADKFVYIVAVVALGSVSIGVVVAIYSLAFPQIDPLVKAALLSAGPDVQKIAATRIAFSIPDGLIALGSAAIGALAGLLGPLSQRRG